MQTHSATLVLSGRFIRTDRYKNLYFALDEKSKDRLTREVKDWLPKGPIEDKEDREGKSYTVLRVKACPWSRQEHNFKSFEKFFKQQVSIKFVAKEYKFKNDEGQQCEGWSATLQAIFAQK